MATEVDWDQVEMRRGSGYAFDEDDDELDLVDEGAADGAAAGEDDDEPRGRRGGDGDDKARLRQLEAELEAERAARAQVAVQQRTQEIAQVKAREAELERQRKQASEEDDWDKFHQLDAELRQVSYRRMRMEEEPAAAPETAGRQDPAANLVPAARSWIKRNQGWFEPGAEGYDPKKAERARAIAKRLEERYDLEDPELYRELDRQLQGRTGQPRRDRVAGDGRSLGQPSTGRRVGRPSPDEAKSMKRYGFDSNNPRDVANWRARNADLG